MFRASTAPFWSGFGFAGAGADFYGLSESFSFQRFPFREIRDVVNSVHQFLVILAGAKFL